VSAPVGVVRVHDECGAEVFAGPGGQLFDLGLPGGEAGSVAHLCRDYVAWHRTGGDVDRRDVWTLDVAGGWQPRRAAASGVPRAA
jgi:hypothetical protein